MSNSHFEVLAQCKTGYGTHRLPSYREQFATREEAQTYLNQNSKTCPIHNSEVTEMKIAEIGQSYIVTL